MDFPNDFVPKTTALPEGLGQAADEAIKKITAQGFEVHAGLTREYADQISRMALEPAIRKFCPKDSSERFVDEAAVSHWLAKKRGAFLLLKRQEDNSLSLAGYGWVGAGANPHIPGGQTTFAIRIGEAGQGKGLAAPFSWLMVAGAAELYGAKNIWLETWASNAGAVHIYHKIGFVTVAEEPDRRLVPDGGTEADVRVYMSLPNELLPSNNK